jgi:hypothetical protein
VISGKHQVRRPNKGQLKESVAAGSRLFSEVSCFIPAFLVFVAQGQILLPASSIQDGSGPFFSDSSPFYRSRGVFFRVIGLRRGTKTGQSWTENGDNRQKSEK